MTAPHGGDGLAAAIEALARDAAPDVLSRALDDARAEARAILQRRLVDALLEEAGRTAGGPVAAPLVSVPAAAPLVSVPAAAESPAAEHGLYVYGITTGDADGVAGLAGVERTTTYPIVAGDLVAVVSDVSGERHRWGIGADGEPDLALLAPRLEEHEKVLEGILERGTVLPMRFGTLYTSRAAVSELLEAHGTEIGAVLDRVAGKVEWGLTVSWDGRRAAAALSDGHPERPGTRQPVGSPGRAYLGRREAEKARAERMADSRTVVSTQLHRAIDQVADASVVHRLPRAGGHEDGTETLMRASYLVARPDRERFERVIVEGLEANAALGLSGELTGPWPPYNFSDLELHGASA